MSGNLSKIEQHIDGLRTDIIELQRELVSRPALGPDNGGEGEKAKADYLLEYLKETGLQDIKLIKAPDKRVPCGYRPSIMGRIPGKDRSRTLWIISHIDVVPAGDRALWKSDPFTLQVDGNTLIGRGVEDNQQGMVCSLMLAKAITATRVSPDIDLAVMLVADEETGNKYGIDFIVENNRDLFNENDWFLVPDVGADDSSLLEIAEKGQMWIKFTVTGKQCHASTPEKGVNSLVGMADLVLELDTLSEKFPEKNDIFSPACSTFVPSKKEANVPNINTLPGQDVFYMDCRLIPEHSIENVSAELRKMADRVAKRRKVKIDIELVQSSNPAPPTDPEGSLARKLMQGVQKVYNVTPQPLGIGGGTVAAALRPLGYQVIGWSTLAETAHQPNEYSLIPNIIGDTKVMASLLFD